MSEPIVGPTEPPAPAPAAPPTEPPPALPEPPPEEVRRPVASVLTRAGSIALELVLMACTLGFGWVGWWIITWADGQSPAKVVLRLHVVDASTGKLASFGRMVLREAVGRAPAGAALAAGAYWGQWWLVALGLAYVAAGTVLAATDTRHRTLWDRLARTVVLQGDPPFFVPVTPVEPSTAPS